MWSLKANITAYGNPAPAVTIKVEKVADKNGDVSSNDDRDDDNDDTSVNKCAF